MKHEIRNPKSETSNKYETRSTKRYDLEERTLLFAKAVRVYVKELPKNTATYEDSKQVVRSSGLVGANYREANDSLSKKDFVMRIKIARKEAKETIFWLELLAVESSESTEPLIDEATQLMKILGSILKGSE